MVRYVNASTGQIVESDDPMPVFDRSAKWQREVVDEPKGDDARDLSKLKRGELNQRAAELGIEEPEKLPNAGAVIDAIKAAEEQPS